MAGIYIHIPFCSKRCVYCDFYFLTNLKLVERFLSDLHKEISLSSDLYKDEKFETIYFGGGTPSLLDAAQLGGIIQHLKQNFNISPLSEITIEANPEDLIGKDITQHKAVGINRMSFGVQSFSDDELKFLTRNHSSADAENVIREAIDVLGNISLDIIYSLPGQTQAQLENNLDKAIALNIPHISAYTLTYEQKTPLYKMLMDKKIVMNTEDVEADMYKLVSDKLTAAGYRHYEVSNFAKPGYESKHNMLYWKYANYIGFGPSSHSFYNFVRWNNYRDLIKYNNDLESGKLPRENIAVLGENEKKLEYLLVSLRSMGVNYDVYEKMFNESFTEKFRKEIDELLKNEYAKQDDEGFHLSSKGYAVADEIIAKYF